MPRHLIQKTSRLTNADFCLLPFLAPSITEPANARWACNLLDKFQSFGRYQQSRTQSSLTRLRGNKSLTPGPVILSHCRLVRLETFGTTSYSTKSLELDWFNETSENDIDQRQKTQDNSGNLEPSGLQKLKAAQGYTRGKDRHPQEPLWKQLSIEKSLRLGPVSIQGQKQGQGRLVPNKWSTHKYDWEQIIRQFDGLRWTHEEVREIFESPRHFLYTLRRLYPDESERIAGINEQLMYGAFHYLERAQHRERREAFVAATLKLLRRVLNTKIQQHIFLNARLLWLLMQNANRDEALELYLLCDRANFKAGPMSLFSFSDILAEHGHLHQAVEIFVRSLNMKRVVRHRPDVVMPILTNLLGKLLGQGDSESGEKALGLLKLMVRFGYVPNVYTYGALITEAFKARNFLLADDLKAQMRLAGLQSQVVDMVMLHGYWTRGRQDDLVEMKKILAIYEDADTPLYDGKVACQLIDANFRLLSFPEYANPLSSMYKIFCKSWDNTPLITLGMLDWQLPNGIKHKAPTGIINVMLKSYLMNARHTSDAFRVYKRFIGALDAGDPDISPLAQSATAYDSFIFYTRNFEDGASFQFLLTIPGDMLRFSDPAGRPDLVPGAPPSMKTWTTMMRVLLVKKRLHLAYRIRDILREHGVPMEERVYNVFLVYLLKAQRYSEAAETLRERSRASSGHEMPEAEVARLMEDPERLLSQINNETWPPRSYVVKQGPPHVSIPWEISRVVQDMLDTFVRYEQHTLNG
ncbi:MAG: hypothetical protein M1814_004678 [Vezdaea aestivalis]|nr:MAG: hypothetical protein M1814_004678 [Vezdaea aestivalis]